MKWTPKRLKFALNIYPPYLGAGVRVLHVGEDWREMHVTMKLRWYNRNLVGTHFGGSLYAMVEPHPMLMLMQLLGRDYIVWDKSAAVDFVIPGRGCVHSVIRISDAQLQDIKDKTADGNKYLPEFELRIVDEENKTVATVYKTVYVRKKSMRSSKVFLKSHLDSEVAP